MFGAIPATISPSRNSAMDAYRATFGPDRSDQAPVTTIPMTPVARVPANASA